MIKTAKSLTLASMIGLLSAIPAVALSDSINCTPPDPAALRAFFHSPAFNVIDDLDDYAEDLSAYGTPRQAGGVSQQASVPATPVNGTPAAELDLVALRAFFHSPAFNVIDDLDDYTEDLGDVATTSVGTLAQLPQ